MSLDEKCKEIEEYASLLFSIKEISDLVHMSEIELRGAIQHRDSELSQAYHRGKMKTVVMVRKQEIELAKLGSPVAIELMQGYMLSQKVDENE
jgi:hypothetical protein